MIKGGYILQPRKIDESEIAHYPPHVREIWHYLLRKANHKTRKVAGKIIQRGQLVTSYKQIINDLSWKVGYRKESYKKHQIETATKLLMKRNMATTTKTTRGMIVTIYNYDYYQDAKNYETDNETDNETYNQPTGINKNDKNDKNKIKLHSENFKNFQGVISFFDSKFINEKEWLDCYDKLIRIDKYSEDRILEIVKEFRSDGNWWKNNGNFESLLKLRQKNKDKIKYIDLFDKKLNNSSGFNSADTRTQSDMKNFNAKF